MAYPNEIFKTNSKNVIKKSDKSKVRVFPPSRCQNQKNTVDLKLRLKPTEQMLDGLSYLTVP